MHNIPKTSRRLRTVTIAGVALASAGTAVAAAADSNSATTPSLAKTSASATTPQRPPAPNPAADDAKLAKALGISTDRLKAARAARQDDELAAAVKAGKLTSEQQSLIEKLRATGLDFPLPPGVAPAPGSGDDPDTALAKELGISVSKLRDARPAPPAGGPAGGPPAPGAAPGATTPPSAGTKTR